MGSLSPSQEQGRRSLALDSWRKESSLHLKMTEGLEKLSQLK